MTFAIVTPSFNKAPYLSRCLLSVLDQDVPDVDYWVLDACSTDGSALILQEFQARYPQLHVVVAKDQGQSDAINRGFARARGDIMAWLNADDYYLPGTLRKVATFFDRHPDVDIVYGRSHFVDSQYRFVKPHVVFPPRPGLLRTHNHIAQPAAFWRRRVWEAVGPLDVELNWTMDWDFFLRASERFHIAYLDELLAEEVWDGQNKTVTGGAARTEEIAQVARRLGGRRNPTLLYCQYVQVLNRLARPWLGTPILSPVANRVVRTGSHGLLAPLSWLGIHVMF